MLDLSGLHLRFSGFMLDFQVFILDFQFLKLGRKYTAGGKLMIQLNADADAGVRSKR